VAAIALRSFWLSFFGFGATIWFWGDHLVLGRPFGFGATIWFWGNIFADCIDRMRLEASWAAGCRWLGFFAPLVLSWGRLRDQQELSTHALAETGRSSSGGSSGR
jgi:hypothetical protein